MCADGWGSPGLGRLGDAIVGQLLFVCKKQHTLFQLDLDRQSYTVQSTWIENIAGGGSYEAGPDQLLQLDGMLFLTEDGGTTPGVYVLEDGKFRTLLEARAPRYKFDETTGLAFSPDGTCLFLCFQEIGFLCIKDVTN